MTADSTKQKFLEGLRRRIGYKQTQEARQAVGIVPGPKRGFESAVPPPAPKIRKSPSEGPR